IDVPAGRSLTTAGQPGANLYAKMARIVRTAPQGDVIVLRGDAMLSAIWVDGNRNYTGLVGGAVANIRVLGPPSQGIGCRGSDPAGFSALYLRDDGDNVGSIVHNNLLTLYVTSHVPNVPVPGVASPWSDGISCEARDADISGNSIIDPTDVGIVVFR